jgi:CRISPR-associated protein Csm5
MKEKIQLKITTITPVTIGSGVELSPYADYVIDGNQVYFIDKKKLAEKILQKNERLLDLYIYGVANKIDNNRSEFDLKSFLYNNRICNLEDVVSSRCALTGNTVAKLPIKGLLKTPLAEPYFAGSSIKGALKTVLMYNWLKTNGKADKKIEEVINGGNFNSLEKQFEYDIVIGQGTNTIQQVTDSKPLAKDANIVVDCYRKMPIRFECVAKGKTTEFELTLDGYKWDELAKQANDYATDVLEREFALIEEQKNINKYFNYLVDIEDAVQNANNNVVYLRIGFGKGYYLNSLGIAIYDYVSQRSKEDLYDKFEKYINEEFARKDKYGKRQEIKLEDFPKTRLYITKTQEPLGWIKIEKI